MIHDFWLHRWVAWVIDFRKTKQLPRYLVDQTYRQMFSSVDQIFDLGEQCTADYPDIVSTVRFMKTKYIEAARKQSLQEVKNRRKDVVDQFNQLLSNLKTLDGPDYLKNNPCWERGHRPVQNFVQALYDASCSANAGHMTSAQSVVLESAEQIGANVVIDMFRDARDLKQFINNWADKFVVDPEQVTESKRFYQEILEMIVIVKSFLDSRGIPVTVIESE